MDQPVESKDLDPEPAMRGHVQKPLFEGKERPDAQKRQKPVNHAVKQNMVRELRAQCCSEETIARLLHLKSEELDRISGKKRKGE